jgi:hypothetical protein
MATIAAATAGDVSDAVNGSSPPGRRQNTAGPPAGSGHTERGIRVVEKSINKGGFCAVSSLALDMS